MTGLMPTLSDLAALLKSQRASGVSTIRLFSDRSKLAFRAPAFPRAFLAPPPSPHSQFVLADVAVVSTSLLDGWDDEVSVWRTQLHVSAERQEAETSSFATWTWARQPPRHKEVVVVDCLLLLVEHNWQWTLTREGEAKPRAATVSGACFTVAWRQRLPRCSATT